jgi:hypothetical protein
LRQNVLLLAFSSYWLKMGGERSSAFAFQRCKRQQTPDSLTFVPNAQTLLCRVLFGVPIAVATMQRCCDYEPHWSISDHHGTSSSSTLVELPRPLVTGTTTPFESTNLDWPATTPGHNPKAAVVKSVRFQTQGDDLVTDLQRLKLEPWTSRTTIPVVVLKSDAQHVDSFDLQLPSMPIASTDNTEPQLVWNGYRIAAIVEDPAISHARHYSLQPKEADHMCMFPYNDCPPPLVNATYALDDLQCIGGVNS